MKEDLRVHAYCIFYIESNRWIVRIFSTVPILSIYQRAPTWMVSKTLPTDDEIQPLRISRKPDISVGYVLRHFDLTTTDEMSTEDFVVLTDRKEMTLYRRRRSQRRQSGDGVDDKEEEDKRGNSFTVWRVS